MSWGVMIPGNSLLLYSGVLLRQRCVRGSAPQACTAAGVIMIARINPKQSTATSRLRPDTFLAAS